MVESLKKIKSELRNRSVNFAKDDAAFLGEICQKYISIINCKELNSTQDHYLDFHDPRRNLLINLKT
jgi:hypothetical protein